MFGERVNGRALGLPFTARQGIGMHRNEKCGVARTRKPDPFTESNECVFRPCHRDAIFSSALQFLAQGLCESEHDVLFKFSTRSPGPGVDAAMSGVQHDERTSISLNLWRRLTALGSYAGAGL